MVHASDGAHDMVSIANLAAHARRRRRGAGAGEGAAGPEPADT
jgi:hypothetical protein